MGSLKSWGARCGSPSFSGRSWELGVPFRLYGAVLGFGLMVRGCLRLSHLFRCGYCLICLVCRSRLASFWIFLWGNFSVCSCTFGVSVGGGTFRSLWCHHLGPSLGYNYALRLKDITRLFTVIFSRVYSGVFQRLEWCVLMLLLWQL